MNNDPVMFRDAANNQGRFDKTERGGPSPIVDSRIKAPCQQLRAQKVAMDRKTVPRHPESHGGGLSTVVPVMSLLSS